METSKSAKDFKRRSNLFGFLSRKTRAEKRPQVENTRKDQFDNTDKTAPVVEKEVKIETVSGQNVFINPQNKKVVLSDIRSSFPHFDIQHHAIREEELSIYFQHLMHKRVLFISSSSPTLSREAVQKLIDKLRTEKQAKASSLLSFDTVKKKHKFTLLGFGCNKLLVKQANHAFVIETNITQNHDKVFLNSLFPRPFALQALLAELRDNNLYLIISNDQGFIPSPSQYEVSDLGFSLWQPAQHQPRFEASDVGRKPFLEQTPLHHLVHFIGTFFSGINFRQFIFLTEVLLPNLPQEIVVPEKQHAKQEVDAKNAKKKNHSIVYQTVATQEYWEAHKEIILTECQLGFQKDTTNQGYECNVLSFFSPEIRNRYVNFFWSHKPYFLTKQFELLTQYKQKGIFFIPDLPAIIEERYTRLFSQITLAECWSLNDAWFQQLSDAICTELKVDNELLNNDPINSIGLAAKHWLKDQNNLELYDSSKLYPIHQLAKLLWKLVQEKKTRETALKYIHRLLDALPIAISIALLDGLASSAFVAPYEYLRKLQARATVEEEGAIVEFIKNHFDQEPNRLQLAL